MGFLLFLLDWVGFRKRRLCQPQQGRGWWETSRGYSRIHLLVLVGLLKIIISCFGTLSFLGISQFSSFIFYLGFFFNFWDFRFFIFIFFAGLMIPLGMEVKIRSLLFSFTWILWIFSFICYAFDVFLWDFVGLVKFELLIMLPFWVLGEN